MYLERGLPGPQAAGIALNHADISLQTNSCDCETPSPPSLTVASLDPIPESFSLDSSIGSVCIGGGSGCFVTVLLVKEVTDESAAVVVGDGDEVAVDDVVAVVVETKFVDMKQYCSVAAVVVVIVTQKISFVVAGFGFV
ncbi:hypothetical protein TSUD_104780 [Trifolium subterraneum]|uniref:Uncharacterized protein n=1 Tax=Trifolium subterraneum TaxID=3900 RepID=A0A2Z6M721_TRISU|nr:hypothetical protein TSUD_104780 [Trifolium subterraneum]